MIQRRRFLKWIGASAAMPLPAFAQKFPARQLRLIVPFPPGGGVDQVARGLVPALAEALGQVIVVENMGGAGGALGTNAARRATPDGYTLLVGTASTHGSNAVVQRLSYDPVEDFAPVSLLMDTPYVLVASNKTPFDSVQAFNAYAKQNPGKVNYGSYGVGSSNHLAAELYKALSGAEISHIAYRGASPATTALMAGEIDVMFDTLPNVVPFLNARSIKPLGVGASKRSPLYPDLPTIAESGVPDYVAGTWFGVWAPKETPPAVLQTLQDAFAKVSAQPEVVAQFEQKGNRMLGGNGRDLDLRVRNEIESLRKLVRERQLKFD